MNDGVFISTESVRVIDGGSRDRALGGAKFQRSSKKLLKSNRISIAYIPKSNSDQIFINKRALFSCYIEKYIDFVPLSGTLGGMVAFGPIESAFEGRGSI